MELHRSLATIRASSDLAARISMASVELDAYGLITHAEFELGSTVTLYGLHPHMHGRGKDFEYRIKLPGGETRTLLRVPNYRATWQLWYDLAEPIVLPKGTVIECTAHFDNSADNRFNPDPRKFVRFGDPTYDEMMIDFLKKGDHVSAIDIVPEYRSKCSPEGFFAHYSMLVGALGGKRCKAAATQYGNYESALGTGQVMLWFPIEG